MNAERDLTMGRALAAGPLPELRAGFYDDLLERLEQARRETSPGHARRERLLRAGLVAAALACAAAATVVVVLFGMPGVRGTGPQTSLAAQVLARMTSSLGAIRTFEADEISIFPGSDGTSQTTTRHVFLTADGDGRIEAGQGRYVEIQNEARGTYWSLKRVHGRLVAETVAVGMPAGDVFDSDFTDMFMEAGYGTALRALLAAHQRGLRVRVSTFEGRPAWTVDFAYPELGADILRLTVDQQTGLVFATGGYRDGQSRPVWERRVERVRIDRPLPRALFLPPAALHLEPHRPIPAGNDRGFRRLPLARVQRLVGYAPLVPARVPAGYRLADVTAKPRTAFGGAGGSSPLVSLVYRRGLASFTVAIMPDGGSALASPGGGAITWGDLRQRLTLAGGALAGSRADIFIGLWAGTAQIFVSGSDTPLDVMIKGDLTRDELVAVAQSLRAYTEDR